jgi:hypothetical protein
MNATGARTRDEHVPEEAVVDLDEGEIVPGAVGEDGGRRIVGGDGGVGAADVAGDVVAGVDGAAVAFPAIEGHEGLRGRDWKRV